MGDVLSFDMKTVPALYMLIGGITLIFTTPDYVSPWIVGGYFILLGILLDRREK